MEKFPVRIDEWKEKDIVIVIKPKFKTKIGKFFARIFGIAPTYSIKLDIFGSFIWKLCDGKNSVEEIGKKLKERFGKEAEPLYERLATFLNIMEKNNMIRFK